MTSEFNHRVTEHTEDERTENYYYSGSRAKALLAELRSTVERGENPPPLRSSARCDRCSLAGICLPDKVSEVRIREVSQVCLYGGVEITTPAMNL
ncbi:MAG: hypothetical protein NTY37_06575 [Methanothrix sp.]|nr:hypothetical protein [Methanothrix sp.]